MRAVTATAVVALLLVAAVSGRLHAAPKAHQLTSAYTYDQYMKHFRRPHVKGGAEYQRRKAIFDANLRDVLRHNANPAKTYTMGINHMSDYLPTELQAMRGTRFTPEHQSPYEFPFVPTGVKPAAELDYRRAFPAVLTAVKDQGLCGDCWAHAVTETIESAYARATGNLYVLSQQQVTSCTPPSGFENACQSCQGQYTRYAFDYAANASSNFGMGIMENWQYPFVSWAGAQPGCNVSTFQSYPSMYPERTTVQISGYYQIPRNNETALVEALNVLGPLSVLVDASAWTSYEGGIYTAGTVFNATSFFYLDHAVQLVGYGRDTTLAIDYWIVRNSWSAGWGEHGYIRLERTSKPSCGLTKGLSCFNNIPNVTSCGSCGLFTDVQYAKVIVPAESGSA